MHRSDFDRASLPSSSQSTESVPSYQFEEVGWDKLMLLNLSDLVRASIKHEEGIGPDASKLSLFLVALLKEEESRHPTMNFVTIKYARLDKLVEGLLHFAELMKAARRHDELPASFLADASHCKKLRAIWIHRFREQYVMIDQLRCTAMVKSGRLKEVSFTEAITYDLRMWHTAATNLFNEVEGNQRFDPGHWWLNIKIRLLRGYRLKSVLAPQAGVRYDGLYIIRQYGTKLDEMASRYRLELVLERVRDQNAMHLLKKFPKPSQLDDWNLYEKLEGDKIKLMEGDAKYIEWRKGGGNVRSRGLQT